MIDEKQTLESTDETVDQKHVSAHATKTDVEVVDKNGKRTKRKNEDLAEHMKDFAQGNYGPDYERRKAEIHREIQQRIIKPEDLITGKTWEKTSEEREAAKIAKAKHNALLRAHGINRKKQMNVLPGDEIVNVKSTQKKSVKKVAKK
jgi:hypothetical protein